MTLNDDFAEIVAIFIPKQHVQVNRHEGAQQRLALRADFIAAGIEQH